MLTAGCIAGILLVELFLELRDRGFPARFPLLSPARPTFAWSTLRVAGYVMLWNLIVLFPQPDPTRRSIVDVLSEAPGGLLFHTAEEVDAYMREERESWD